MRRGIFTTEKNGKGTEEDTDVRKKAVVVARLVFVLRAAPDEQKGVSTLKADENKNVFSMAYILVLSMFWGLGH